VATVGDKMKNLGKKRKYVVVKILCLSIALISVAFFCYSGKVKKNDIRQIEKLTKLHFPTSVEWQHVRIDSWLDYSIICSFLIEKQDILLLLKDIEGDREVVWSKTDRGFTVRRGPRWYRPDKLKDFKYMRTHFPKENTTLEIIYDDSRQVSDKTLVYLVWWET
jgi:hypothetical protein